MDGSKEEVAPLVQQLLQDKAALLKECFAIQVTSEGLLTGLPQLIEGHSPDLSRLPYFVLQLARDVDWENEKECFRGLAQVCFQYHMWGSGTALHSGMQPWTSQHCNSILRSCIEAHG